MFVFNVQERGLGFDSNKGVEREASHTLHERLVYFHRTQLYSFLGEEKEKRNVLIKIMLFFILY